jgi:dephospho-CoA kinase
MKQNNPDHIKIIGLTGGVGSGKSTVANMMQKDFQARVIIADEIGYMAMKPGETSYQEIVSNFGTGILEENQEINRQKLADIVFQNDEKLKLLNSIIHPFVHNYVLRVIEDVKQNKSANYIVVESAILIEAGYQGICDEIWHVAVDDQIRRERLKQNRGYTEEKINAIVKKQMAESEYNKYATRIIYNNGDVDGIYKQLELLLV